MLTSLALLIWYFPLWHMGISGYEAFLLITITPMVLGIRSLRKVMASQRGFFHFISLIGLASYAVQDPAYRLICTAIGLGISTTTWMATWIESRNTLGKQERSTLIWGVGLLVHNVVKMAWWTENPIWPIMNSTNGGCNLIGLVLAAVACVEVLVRDNMNRKPTHDVSTQMATHTVADGSSWFQAAAGFGGVLFALHSLFSDSSAIMRWSVDGYPSFGPEPVPWGVATIAALALGLYVSPKQSLTTSLMWFGMGGLGCTAFYVFAGWNAYYGGLALGFYCTSILLPIVRAVSVHPPFKTLLTAFMCYNVLCLASVWTVAYAFVPGGVYLRERIHWVLALMMAFIGLGVYNARKQVEEDHLSKTLVQRPLVKEARSLTRLALVAVMAVSGLVATTRSLASVTPAPYHSAEKSFTAGIWTIHFALDNDMWASERRMRDAIRDLELDVVGLLESDTMRIIMGNRDWAQYIAEDLGYYLDYVSVLFGSQMHTRVDRQNCTRARRR